MIIKKKKKYGLSIIFPVYNEEKNIVKLKKEINYLIKQNFFDLEIIFVNDGSTDKTKKNLINYLKTITVKKKIISYKKNKGKGFALKLGVLKSSKEWVLTSDADLSVSLNHVVNWFKKKEILIKNYAYFANRNHKYSKLNARLHRKIIGFFFHSFFKIIFMNSISFIEDTQCGFKLYNRYYIKKIFSKMTENGFVHDIEISILLYKNNINIKQMPVKWVFGKTSRVNLVKDSFLMFFKIFTLKLKYKI